jgi:hypothetical protein
MSANFDQAQIQFNAQLASLHSKVKALKSLLTQEQLKEFDESILKDKEKFLQKHLVTTTQTLELIEKFYS